jgi:hypothetical protein
MLAGTGLPFLLTAILSGQPPAYPPVESVVLERIKIAKGGDAILLPVKIAGRERMFVLDTGASHTGVDRSLLNGDITSMERIGTADREIDVLRFPAPEATVGSLGFNGIDKVVGIDLMPLREASGLPIEGILGMDFLSRHVVRVDFDKGELCFLTAAEPRCGIAIPLTDGDDGSGRPQVRGSVGGLERIPFLVDTGYGTLSSGSLDAATFSLLKKWKDLRIVGQGVFRCLSGDGVEEIGQSSVFAVGDVRVERPVWTSGKTSALGLGFLSRFVVTFDFPKGVMYLSPGADVAKQDLWNGSGLRLLRKKGEAVVERMDADSPGERAGLRSGDSLIRVGDEAAGTGSLFELRKALCGRGLIHLAVRHMGEELALTLNVGQ